MSTIANKCLFVSPCRRQTHRGRSAESTITSVLSSGRRQEPPTMAEPPKAYFTNEKWDQALDLMLRRTVYGTLAGGVAALVLLSECARGGQAGG